MTALNRKNLLSNHSKECQEMNIGHIDKIIYRRRRYTDSNCAIMTQLIVMFFSVNVFDE